jgi:hypothetical protein
MTGKELKKYRIKLNGEYISGSNYENGCDNIGKATGEYIVETIFRDMTGREFRGGSTNVNV